MKHADGAGEKPASELGRILAEGVANIILRRRFEMARRDLDFPRQ